MRQILDNLIARIRNWRRSVEWENILRGWLEGGGFRIDEVHRWRIDEDKGSGHNEIHCHQQASERAER